MSQIVEETVKILNKTGLHVRPMSKIVKKAKEFASSVILSVEGKGSASAKSLFKLQAIEMPYGTEIIIKAEGEDAQKAASELKDLIANMADE